MNAENSAGLTWAGDIGDDRAFHCVVHLTNEHLFVNFAYLMQFGRDEAVCRLEKNEPPEQVFGAGTHKFVLAAINELRFCHALNLLEIYHGPSNQRYEIQSQRDPLHVWLYSTLRLRLAPESVPETGVVSRAGALSGPLWGLGFAVVLAGLFVYWATHAGPDPHNEGRSAALKDLIENFLFKIGVKGTTVIASGVILGFLGWITYRWKNPPVAEVIKIVRPTDAAKP